MAITFENAAAATTFLNNTVQVGEAAVKYSDIEVKVGNFAEKFFNFFRNLVEIIRNTGLRNIQVTVQGAGDESAVTTRIKVTVAVRDELTNANIRYANNVIESAARAAAAAAAPVPAAVPAAGTSAGTVLVPETPSASSHSSSSEAEQAGGEVVVAGTPSNGSDSSSESSQKAPAAEDDSRGFAVPQSSSMGNSEEDEFNVLGEGGQLALETAVLTGGATEAERQRNRETFEAEVAPHLATLATGEGGPFLPNTLQQFVADQRAEGGRGGRALARGGEVSAQAARLAPVAEEPASQQPLENTGTDS